MKFLLDAHLPPSLKELFLQKDLEVIHTTDLPEKNSTKDSFINRFSKENGYIVITKDSDFYYSHVVNDIPEKLIIVKTGNISKEILKDVFKRFLEKIVEILKTHNILELHRDRLIY